MVPTWYIWDEWSAKHFGNTIEQGLPPLHMRWRALRPEESEPEVPVVPEESDEDFLRRVRNERSWFREYSLPENRKKRHLFITEKMAEIEKIEQARRAQQNAAERQRTMDRERTPGANGPSLHVWELDPDERDPTKYFRRTVLGSSAKKDVLAEHTDNQTRYFPALNVWHVCEGLAPGEWVHDPWDESDDEDDVPQHPDSAPEAEGPTADPLPDMNDHQPTERFQEMKDKPSANASFSKNFKLKLAETFGWVPPIPLPPPTDLVALIPENQRVNFLRALGRAYHWQKDAADQFFRSPEAASAWSLYQTFTSTLGQTHDTDVFDLNLGCPKPIPTHLMRHICIIESAGHPPLYMFNVRGADYNVAVYSPIVALAACRYDPDSTESLVEFLYKYGAPFQTLLPEVDPLPPYEEQFPPTLPRRPHQYAFGPSDYYAYIAGIAREMFRKSRAAVLRGGYIWRLSSTHLHLADAMEGPTSKHNLEVEYAGRRYIDDKLTPTDEAIIVGTYIVDDGRGGSTTMSWWPPADMFDANTGENYEYWTDFNEVGFVARENLIKAGKAGPLTRAQWKAKLKGIPQTRVWKDLLHRRSEVFIRDEIDREIRRQAHLE